MLYAKSDPEESIKRHTEELLKRQEDLKRIYGKEILKEKQIDTNKFWEMLYIECKYHDIGKAYTPFQNMILEKLKKEQILSKFSNNVKHEQLSPMFIPKEVLAKFTKEEKQIIIQSIYYHHERNNSVLDRNLIDKIILEDIKPKINEIQQEVDVKLNHQPTNFYMSYVGTRDRIRQGHPNYIKYCLQKGLLHRIDYSASAHLEIEEDTTDNIRDFIKVKMKDNKYNENDLQKYVQQHYNDNMVIIGSTGMGKTEAGLLWSNGSKTFFTLPIRISINAIYDRMIEEYNYSHVGLLHSSSLDYLEEKKNTEGDEDNYLKNEEAKILSKKITTCTIDQIFTFVLKYRGYERIYATLSYSKIIIDEIQAYSPEIVAIILKGLEMIYKIGGKFLIMTATLPRIYKEKLEEMGVPFKSEQFLSTTKRHKIKIENKEIDEDITNIIQKSKDSKILIIVNTVDKAIKLYNEIKEKTENVYTLHSRFIAKDRQEKEEGIREFAKNKELNGIWITTQIVEASIDIDFDYLYTEMSTLDSLFQRLGRCYRKREWESEECNVFIYTQNISGIGYVYDKEIYNKSLKLLKNYDQKLLTEEDKVKMVDILYSKEFLEGTQFIKKFEEGIKVLNNMVDYDTNKNEAQKLFRDIVNLKVIPKAIYDKNSTLFENYRIEKDRKNKTKIRREIEKLTTNISLNQARKMQDKLFDIGLENIKGIDTKYSRNIGLILDQTLEDSTNSRML